MSALYEQCSTPYFDGSLPSDLAVLQCISNAYESDQAVYDTFVLEWGLILTGSLVFFMQAGFAALCAGCVRRKNWHNTMLKNLLDASFAALAFYCTGYALAFGDSAGESGVTFAGNQHFFGHNLPSYGAWFFQYACSSATVTIVAGTLAERCQVWAYMLYSLVLAGLVYPIVVHAVWSTHGFLSVSAEDPLWGVGAIDFAGTGVVHLTGGWTALIATYMVGPREGRFYHVGSRSKEPLDIPEEIPGHSIALQLLGTMILWFGWYGFNPGSALFLSPDRPIGQVATLAAVNTTCAAAAGAVTSFVTRIYMQERITGEYEFSLTALMNGGLAGLVSITSGCGTVQPWAASVIGIISGWIYLWGHSALIRWRIDDVVDAIPVHCFAATWGVLATGLFSAPENLIQAYGSDDYVGWVYEISRGSASWFNLLACQFVLLAFILLWVGATMTPFFYLLQKANIFRVDQLEELLGLDQHYHEREEDANAARRQLGHIRDLLNEPSVSSTNKEER